jgi:hypothetical protein
MTVGHSRAPVRSASYAASGRRIFQLPLRMSRFTQNIDRPRKLFLDKHIVRVTAHEVFLKNHVGESPEEFRTQWRKEIFTGQGSMPKAFDSESDLIEYVAATPGAVGYVSRVSSQDRVKSLPTVK